MTYYRRFIAVNIFVFFLIVLQFFLSDRAVYLLLWNVRLGYEHAGLDFWFNSISVHAPKAPIFVVGTHLDQVSLSELPVDEMSQRYPQIAGFHFISAHTGEVRVYLVLTLEK